MLLAHEWLSPTGGSENVFEQFLKLFPKSRAVCLWNDAPARFGMSIEETWLAATPLRRSKAFALPLMPSAWRSVDLTGVDRVLTSTHAFSHHLAARASEQGIPAYSYIHSPARYVWAPEADHRGRSFLARTGGKYLRKLDSRRTSPKVNYAANSEFVRTRIQRAWGVDSTVIHPPVDVARIQSVADWRTHVSGEELGRLDKLPEEFVLGASRLVEYKRLEAAIAVGEALGIPTVIVGEGPDEARLKRIADSSSAPVIFFGFASMEALHAIYQRSSLAVFMAVEDFGLMPVEAMACGAFVVVNSVGGASESVSKIRRGVALSDSEFRPDAILAAMTSAPKTPMGIDEFGLEAFNDRVRSWTFTSYEGDQ